MILHHSLHHQQTSQGATLNLEVATIHYINKHYRNLHSNQSKVKNQIQVV